MIKVLHFVSTPAIWSGVMSVIMNYYRHIDRSRVQFDFLCFLPCEESYEKEINELGGQVFFISKPSASPHTLKELTAFFKKHQGEYQWLHNHEVYLSFLLKPISEHYGIKDFIVHIHATRYSDRKWAAVRNRILCFPIRFMKCHRFACSKAAGNFLYSYKDNSQENFYILKNVIDASKYYFNLNIREKYRHILGIENSFVIGCVGRFTSQKNLFFLLQIFKQLSEEVASAKLLLIGDGPLNKKLRRTAKALGIYKNVLFLGSRSDIPQLLQAMDVFTLTSVYEGLPISCIEAQAAGLPCILADTISSEVAFNNNVCFLPLDSEKQWSSAYKYILDTPKNMRIAEREKEPFLPDIKAEARKLTQFYLSKGEDC